jgi:hypothetical protein
MRVRVLATTASHLRGASVIIEGTGHGEELYDD